MVFDQGPMGNGKFPQEAIDVLEYLGRWLAVNGEGIYATRPWKHAKQGEDMYFTRSKDDSILFVIIVGWPDGPVVVRDVAVAPGGKITMLGIDGECPWSQEGTTVSIEVPASFNKRIPCEFAHVLKVPLARES